MSFHITTLRFSRVVDFVEGGAKTYLLGIAIGYGF